MVHHITIQTTLFLVAGLVERRAGSTDLRRLGGLARVAPLLGVLFFVPAMNLAGIPPFSGFLGKLGLLQAGVAAGGPLPWVLVAAGTVTSLLTLYVASPGVEHRLLARAPAGHQRAGRPAAEADGRAPPSALVALGLALTVLAGPLFDVTARRGRGPAAADPVRAMPCCRAVCRDRHPGAGSRRRRAARRGARPARALAGPGGGARVAGGGLEPALGRLHLGQPGRRPAGGRARCWCSTRCRRSASAAGCARWALLVFAGRFVVELVSASLHVARIAVQPGYRPRGAIIAVRLRVSTDLNLALTAEAVSLVPGTLILEVDRDSGTLYLHVLDTHGPATWTRPGTAPSPSSGESSARSAPPPNCAASRPTASEKGTRP